MLVLLPTLRWRCQDSGTSHKKRGKPNKDARTAQHHIKKRGKPNNNCILNQVCRVKTEKQRRRNMKQTNKLIDWKHVKKEKKKYQSP